MLHYLSEETLIQIYKDLQKAMSCTKNPLLVKVIIKKLEEVKTVYLDKTGKDISIEIVK